jgi:hypothetical protein
VEHFQLTAEGPAADEERKALDGLHSWLAARGYARLTSREEIDAATGWSGHGAPFLEVWRRTMDPAAPKSEFVVTVVEAGHPKVLFIKLTAERYGEETDHARQMPMVEEERGEFYKGFDAFPWLKRQDFR